MLCCWFEIKMSEQKNQKSREEMGYQNQRSTPYHTKRQLTVEDLLSPEDRKRLAEIVILGIQTYTTNAPRGYGGIVVPWDEY